MDTTTAGARVGSVVGKWNQPLQISVAAALLLSGWAAVGPRPAMLLIGAIAAVTPALVWADVRDHRLPNRMTLPLIVLAIPVVVIDPLATGIAGWVPAAAGLGVGAILLVLSIIGGLGMGDVKLGLGLGFAAGCFGFSAAVASLLLAMLLGGFAGSILLIGARVRRRSDAATRSLAGTRSADITHTAARIAFGPFLLLGFWAVVWLAPVVGIRSGHGFES